MTGSRHDAARGPVVVAGLSHSGKTPLRLALEASGELTITRKTYLWPRYYARFGDLGQPENLRNCLDAILSDPAIQRLSPDRGRLEEEFSHGSATYTRLFGLIHSQHAAGNGTTRWGEQLGGAERFADLILDEYPDASFVHMIRDPRDRMSFIGRRPGVIGWETEKWLDSARRAHANLNNHPGRYHLFRYEDLAADPESALRSICELVDLGFRERMLIALRAGLDSKANPQELGGRQRAYISRRAHHQLVAFGYGSTVSHDRGDTGRMPIETVGAAARRWAVRLPNNTVED